MIYTSLISLQTDYSNDCHEVKIIEDFTDLDANTVSDDIVENSQDTMTLLGKYIDDLDVNLDKTKLKLIYQNYTKDKHKT